MSDSRGTRSAISRRSGRTYLSEDDRVEMGNVVHQSSSSSASSESRYGSADEERDDLAKDIKKQGRNSFGSQNQSIKNGSAAQIVDLGRDLKSMFPVALDDRSNSVIKVLQTAKDHITENANGGRPENFGIVVPGAIYRSSFPSAEHHEFLQTLGLKTVITLVNKEYPDDFLPFLNTLGVRHIIIDMKGTKKVEIPDNIMRTIIRATLDIQNQPVLLHCNHGKHRTGCATAIIRHIAGWDLDDIVEEYSLFAEPKIRECDVKYINEFEIAKLNGVFLAPPVESAIAHSRRPSSKQTRFIVAGALFVCVALVVTLYFKH